MHNIKKNYQKIKISNLYNKVNIGETIELSVIPLDNYSKIPTYQNKLVILIHVNNVIAKDNTK